MFQCLAISMHKNKCACNYWRAENYIKYATFWSSILNDKHDQFIYLEQLCHMYIFLEINDMHAAIDKCWILFINRNGTCLCTLHYMNIKCRWTFHKSSILFFNPTQFEFCSNRIRLKRTFRRFIAFLWGNSKVFGQSPNQFTGLNVCCFVEIKPKSWQKS